VETAAVTAPTLINVDSQDEPIVFFLERARLARAEEEAKAAAEAKAEEERRKAQEAAAAKAEEERRKAQEAAAAKVDYETHPLLGFYGSFLTNGGTVGWEPLTLNIQPGVLLVSSEKHCISILGDLMAGAGHGDSVGTFLSYNAGGMVEIWPFGTDFALLFGAGGGIGGVRGETRSLSFPYIRGSLALAFEEYPAFVSIKIYYDYNFENGFKFGFLFGVLFSND
jgi:hypothetical protein